jgi:hypothetical protein
MTTSTIAVVFLTFIIVMAAVVAIMTVIYATRLPSSKAGENTVRKSKLPVGESTQSETFPELTDMNNMSKSDTLNSTLPGDEKANSAELRSNTTFLVNREDKSVKKKQPRKSSKKKFSFTSPKMYRNKQIQMEQVPPIVNSKAEEPLPDDTVISKLPEIPDLQPLISEPEIEKQMPEPAPDNPILEDVVSSVPAVTNPEVQIKEYELIMEAKSNNETRKTGSDSPVANPETAASKIAESNKTSNEGHQTQQSGMGDLSDLFAKNTSEDKKANKLAEEMNDIDANDLLRNGLGLISKMKKK